MFVHLMCSKDISSEKLNKFRKTLPDEIHCSHIWASLQAVARSYYWWPGLDKAIEKMMQGVNPESTASSKQSVEKTEKPFEGIHIDYCEPN